MQNKTTTTTTTKTVKRTLKTAGAKAPTKTKTNPKALPQSGLVTADLPVCSPAPLKAKVTFVYLHPQAKQVVLSGDFNGWATDAVPMNQNTTGQWETTVALPKGRYQYKFVVDGQWEPDPAARENVWNEHGTLNSVIEVTE